MTLNDALRAFERQKLIDGVKDNSIMNYRATLSLFIAAVGAEKDVSELSIDIMQDYIIELRKSSISIATRASYIRNIKIFLRWLVEEGYTDVAYRKIKVPRSPQKDVRQYSDEEMAYALSLVDSSEEWLRWRNIAIIVLMFDTGMRQLEVCRLDKSLVHFDSGRLDVTGKGDKDRVVRMGNFSIDVIQRYLQECPYKDAKHLFCSRWGGRITGNAIRIFMYELQEKLPFHFSSHKLRHNFATNFFIEQYERTGTCDCQMLQTLMGHSEFKTTQRYLHFAKQIIAAEHCPSHVDNISSNLLKTAIGM